jgi:hypothetical protein
MKQDNRKFSYFDPSDAYGKGLKGINENLVFHVDTVNMSSLHYRAQMPYHQNMTKKGLLSYLDFQQHDIIEHLMFDLPFTCYPRLS